RGLRGLLRVRRPRARVPHEADFSALAAVGPTLLSYLLSFVHVGIYWNNHHHLIHAARRINGLILWANLHLLFWLSLVPFVTAWMGENHFAPQPVALYGVVMLMAGVAYYLLSQALIRHHGEDSPLARAVGGDRKGILSVVLYVGAIPAAFVHPWLAVAVYGLVAVIWFIPDPRIERALEG
nr:TMEM175 family protein [Thermoanaerobaculia bacterium]